MLIAATALACGLPESARANIVEVYGFGSRAISMGGAFTALADDFSAVYYNPAGLMFPRHVEKPFENQKGINIDLGYVWAQPWLYMQPSGEPKQGIDYASSSGPYLGITMEPSSFYGAFKRKVFAFGLGVYIPVNELFFYEQYYLTKPEFPFFKDYSQRFVVLPSLSFGILKNLSLGVGISLLLRFHTDTTGQVIVSAENFASKQFITTQTVDLTKEQVFLGEYEKMTLSLAPIVGLKYVPWDRLSLGFCFRGQNYINDFGFTNPTINLANIMEFPQGFQFKFARFFTPNSFVLGVAVKPLDKLTISCDVGYYMWHKYLDVWNAEKPVPAWHDTVIPRLGVEYALRDWWYLRGGYFFWDSPVPDQTAPGYNLMDNDRNAFSLGSEWVINKPSAFWYKPLRVSVYGQFQQALRRTYNKPEGSEYYPGYSFGGNILLLGAQLSMMF